MMRGSFFIQCMCIFFALKLAWLGYRCFVANIMSQYHIYILVQTLERKTFAGRFVNNYCGSGYVLYFERLLYPVYFCSFMIGDDTSEKVYQFQPVVLFAPGKGSVNFALQPVSKTLSLSFGLKQPFLVSRVQLSC